MNRKKIGFLLGIAVLSTVGTIDAAEDLGTYEGYAFCNCVNVEPQSCTCHDGESFNIPTGTFRISMLMKKCSDGLPATGCSCSNGNCFEFPETREQLDRYQRRMATFVQSLVEDPNTCNPEILESGDLSVVDSLVSRFEAYGICRCANVEPRSCDCNDGQSFDIPPGAFRQHMLHSQCSDGLTVRSCRCSNGDIFKMPRTSEELREFADRIQSFNDRLEEDPNACDTYPEESVQDVRNDIF